MTEDLIRELVSEKIDLPLHKLKVSEKELLNSLETKLSQKIIGQENPLRALCQAVRRGRLRLGSPNRPAGVFLMLGSTGVGKTASAEALSDILYGSKNNMLRLDMSEYKAPHDVSKLIGAPPGYVGHGAGGKLTNWLMKKPNSIVLLDEVEKAHPEILDVLLQVFDAGRITDGNNETIRCLDTTFIMTSNIGAPIILNNYQKFRPDQMQESLVESIEKRFRAEFINRIQETVVFYPLSLEEVSKIAALQCQELKMRVEQNPQCPNLTLTWDDSVIKFLVAKGYKPEKGAREMSRLITHTMENPLADAIIQEKINTGDRIHFFAENNTMNFRTTPSEVPQGAINLDGIKQQVRISNHDDEQR